MSGIEGGLSEGNTRSTPEHAVGHTAWKQAWLL